MLLLWKTLCILVCVDKFLRDSRHSSVGLLTRREHSLGAAMPGQPVGMDRPQLLDWTS